MLELGGGILGGGHGEGFWAGIAPLVWRACVCAPMMCTESQWTLIAPLSRSSILDTFATVCASVYDSISCAFGCV